MKIFRFSTLMPIGFFLASLGYLAFAATMETAQMIGDTRGYDPGGRLVPLLAAGAMALLSLALFIQEFRTEKAKSEAFTAPAWLTWSYILISMAYILTFRHLGYMLTTSLLLFWFIVLNRAASGVRFSRLEITTWLVAMLGYLCGAYTLMRIVIRSMYWLARNHGLVIAREPVVQAVAVTGVIFLLLLTFHFLSKRLWPGRELPKILQTSIGTTIAVYIAFRLLFLVQLPAGLINWL